MRAIKKTITGICGRALLGSGASGWFLGRRTPIIFYHGIWPSGSPALERFGGLTVAQLQEDLTRLAHHFEFVSLESLLRYNQGRQRMNRPPLAVCFDDGCEMIRSGAADVLDALSVPSTVFVVTACVDNEHLMWMHKFQAIQALRGPDHLVAAYNRLMETTAAGPPIASPQELTPAVWCWPMDRKEAYVDELYQACDMPPVGTYLDDNQPYMTWEDLRVWCERGHAVGLHTHTHPFCDRLAASDLGAEIVAPAALLGRELGVDFVPFAYPFGNRLEPERERQVAEAAGLGCMLGVAGLSPRGTDPVLLERAEAEQGLDQSLFGEPLLEVALRRIRKKPELSVSLPDADLGMSRANPAEPPPTVTREAPDR